MVQQNYKLSTLFIVIIGLAFFIVGVLLILFLNSSMKKNALVEAEEKAYVILNRNLGTHFYFSKQLKPKLFEFTEPFRTAHYFEPTWMSSTYAVREIDKYFKELTKYDYYYKECAINARSPENEADQHESAFIEELNANPDLNMRSEVRTLDGSPYFVTMHRGESMEDSCIRCHDTPGRAPTGLVEVYGDKRSFGRHVGEVVSAISIRIPLASAYTKANRLSMQISLFLIFILGCLFIFQFFFARRYVFKPLTSIRSKALEISTDSAHLGEIITLPAGKEVRDLTQAFNVMSDGLRQNRDHLEERVTERTHELAAANEKLKENKRHLLQEIEGRKQLELELKDSHIRLEKQNVRLRELDRMKSMFIASMSHELRTPLNSIMGFTSVVLDEISGNLNEKQRDQLSRAHRAANHLLSLINDIIDISRIESGNVTAYPETFSLNELIGESVENLQSSIKEKGLALEVDVPEELQIHTDRKRLLQCILNLLSNAVKFSETGTIRMSAGESDSDVSISVSDSGIGISDQDLQKIFQPFERIESHMTVKSGGTGLGLYLTRKIAAELLHGTVEVESEKGKGSTFRLRIPKDIAQINVK